MRPAAVILLAVFALAAAAGLTAAAFSGQTDNAGNSFSTAATFGGMRVQTGTYNGNNTDNRPITTTFQPDAVLVKAATAQIAVMRTSSMTGDQSKPLTGATALQADRIQSFGATSFTVGLNAQVNASGIRYDWIAFKAHAGQMKVSSYAGNGTSQAIGSMGFSPEYLIVMRAGASATVQRSSTMGGGFRFDETAAGAGGITSLDANGFSVGNNAEVNTSGNTYHYLAWNAIPGLMGTGGPYAGNGQDNRSITGATLQPDYAIVKSNETGNVCDRAVHRPALLTGDNSLYFANVANLTNAIQALQADGFQVGTDCRVNENATSSYHWIAFKDSGG